MNADISDVYTSPAETCSLRYQQYDRAWTLIQSNYQIHFDVFWSQWDRQRRSQGEVLRVLGPPLGPFMGPVPRGPGIA